MNFVTTTNSRKLFYVRGLTNRDEFYKLLFNSYDAVILI